DLVRCWSAAAIAHIGTQAAIDPLTRALYDSDQDVRYYAVSGLSRITGEYSWGPGPDYYKPREDHYLNHWKEWAKAR
ncbi:MAG: HEAT repeat domain-containing protein, partial [Blastocatellia bacterium]